MHSCIVVAFDGENTWNVFLIFFPNPFRCRLEAPPSHLICLVIFSVSLSFLIRGSVSSPTLLSISIYHALLYFSADYVASRAFIIFFRFLSPAWFWYSNSVCFVRTSIQAGSVYVLLVQASFAFLHFLLHFRRVQTKVSAQLYIYLCLDV